MLSIRNRHHFARCAKPVPIYRFGLYFCLQPIGNPSLADVMKMKLEQEAMSQRAFAKKIGVSPSRVCEYLSGKSEPTLKIARSISKELNIEPSIILGI